MLISAEGIVLCLVWFRPGLCTGLGFGGCSSWVMWYFEAFLRNSRSCWCSLRPQTVNRRQYSLLTDIWLPALQGWAPAHGNPSSRPRFFFPLMAGAAAGREMTRPLPSCYRGGFQRVGTWALWVGSFESQPGPVLPAMGTGPLVRLHPSCQAGGRCVRSCYFQEELGPAGYNQQNFRKPERRRRQWVPTWVSGSWPASASSQPAVPPTPSGSLGVLFKVVVVALEQQYLNHRAPPTGPAKRVCYGAIRARVQREVILRTGSSLEQPDF